MWPCLCFHISLWHEYLWGTQDIETLKYHMVITSPVCILIDWRFLDLWKLKILLWDNSVLQMCSTTREIGLSDNCPNTHLATCKMIDPLHSCHDIAHVSLATHHLCPSWSSVMTARNLSVCVFLLDHLHLLALLTSYCGSILGWVLNSEPQQLRNCVKSNLGYLMYWCCWNSECTLYMDQAHKECGQSASGLMEQAQQKWAQGVVANPEGPGCKWGQLQEREGHTVHRRSPMLNGLNLIHLTHRQLGN